MEQWTEDKEEFGDLPFDIDPSMFSLAGNQLDVNTAAAAGAAAGATPTPTPAPAPAEDTTDEK